MTEIFFISDMHFGHNNMYKFTNADGSRVRPWAENADEGDKIMIKNWNSVVGENDKVYVVGDVAIPRKSIHIMGALKGKKCLIKGNHDIFKLDDYTPYFYDIRGSHKIDKYVITHIPIHPDSLARWCDGNIHGHVHNNSLKDKRYINVSVEVINQTPISFEELKNKK